MNQSFDLLQQVAVHIGEGEDADHYRRVEDVTGVSRCASEELSQNIRLARRAGFAWAVTGQAMLQYPYAASVSSDIRGDFAVVKETTTRLNVVTYTGDIPDFALDAIERIRQIPGWKHNPITIHSVAPLPVRFTRVVAKTDPVLVMWDDHVHSPHFRYLKSWFRKNIKFQVRHGHHLGIVLAVWGDDHERLV